MTFAKHQSDRRPQAQIRPRSRTGPRPAPRPVQGLRLGYTGESRLQKDARTHAPKPALSWLTMKAASSLSCYSGHAFPVVLLAILSWAVAEILAAFAAYAAAMHPPPAPGGHLPAETNATDTRRAAKPGLSPMLVIDGSAGYSNQARPVGGDAARPQDPLAGVRRGASHLRALPSPDGGRA